MNLPGHRIAACLGKAALKTHALQTLTRRPLTRPRARSVWSASDLSALSVGRGTASGSWPPSMRRSERGLSLNRRRPRQVLECASLSAFAARHSAASARRRLALWQWRRADRKRQRTGALQDATARSAGFMVPMHGHKAEEAFHGVMVRTMPVSDPAEEAEDF
jgi:hypothetical protein